SVDRAPLPRAVCCGAIERGRIGGAQRNARRAAHTRAARCAAITAAAALSVQHTQRHLGPRTTGAIPSTADRRSTPFAVAPKPRRGGARGAAPPRALVSRRLS